MSQTAYRMTSTRNEKTSQYVIPCLGNVCLLFEIFWTLSNVTTGAFVRKIRWPGRREWQSSYPTAEAPRLLILLPYLKPHVEGRSRQEWVGKA